MISHTHTHHHTDRAKKNFPFLSILCFFHNLHVNPLVQSSHLIINHVRVLFITKSNTNFAVYYFLWNYLYFFSFINICGKWKKLGHCIIFIYYFFVWHTQTDDEPCTRRTSVQKYTHSCVSGEMCQIFLFHFVVFFFGDYACDLGVNWFSYGKWEP